MAGSEKGGSWAVSVGCLVRAGVINRDHPAAKEARAIASRMDDLTRGSDNHALFAAAAKAACLGQHDHTRKVLDEIQGRGTNEDGTLYSGGGTLLAAIAGQAAEMDGNDAIAKRCRSYCASRVTVLAVQAVPFVPKLLTGTLAGGQKAETNRDNQLRNGPWLAAPVGSRGFMAGHREIDGRRIAFPSLNWNMEGYQAMVLQWALEAQTRRSTNRLKDRRNFLRSSELLTMDPNDGAGWTILFAALEVISGTGYRDNGGKSAKLFGLTKGEANSLIIFAQSTGPTDEAKAVLPLIKTLTEQWPGKAALYVVREAKGRVQAAVSFDHHSTKPPIMLAVNDRPRNRTDLYCPVKWASSGHRRDSELDVKEDGNKLYFEVSAESSGESMRGPSFDPSRSLVLLRERRTGAIVLADDDGQTEPPAELSCNIEAPEPVGGKGDRFSFSVTLPKEAKDWHEADYAWVITGDPVKDPIKRSVPEPHITLTPDVDYVVEVTVKDTVTGDSCSDSLPFRFELEDEEPPPPPSGDPTLTLIGGSIPQPGVAQLVFGVRNTVIVTLTDSTGSPVMVRTILREDGNEDIVTFNALFPDGGDDGVGIVKYQLDGPNGEEVHGEIKVDGLEAIPEPGDGDGDGGGLDDLRDEVEELGKLVQVVLDLLGGLLGSEVPGVGSVRGLARTALQARLGKLMAASDGNKQPGMEAALALLEELGKDD